MHIFKFKVNKEERAIIDALAENLGRSRSDAVRRIILVAADALMKNEDSHNVEPDNGTEQDE
jgi:uncharacterized protein (DUF1778 family)